LTGANRLADWKDRLTQEFARSHDYKFSRGVHDCTQFAIRCEIAMTGGTKFPEFYDTYRTGKKGYLILARMGFETMFDAVSSRLVEIDPAEAGRGDCIGHIGDEGGALGICAGQHGFFAANLPSGIILRPRDEIVKAWKV